MEKCGARCLRLRKMDDKFIIAPFDILMDKRLTMMQLRVLLALLSFRGRNTNLVWPKRSKIADLVGCSENNVTKVTGQLVKFGWLKKLGNGGCSRSISYQVLVPDLDEISCDDSDKTQSTVATQSVTATQSTVATMRVATVAGGKEETIEETNKEKSNKKEIQQDSNLSLKKLFEFRPESVDEDLWHIFIQIRKKRKATQSARAIRAQLRELALCEKAGISATAAIERFLEESWKSLKCEWICKAGINHATSRGFGKETASERNARISRETTEQHQAAVARALENGTF